ncbi:MAG TPA: TolC family protein [Candidatus Dormibacteraeota bacterium]|nr:TolC family protein [Candidatus Dormibacteraeota bacterium]
MLTALLGTVLVAAATPQPSATPPPSTVTLSLNQAVDRALTGNLRYRQAQESVTSSIAQLRQARSPQFPFLVFSDKYQYTNPLAALTLPPLVPGASPLTLDQGLKNANDPRVSLSYTLFDGGKTASQVGEAAAGVAAAEAQAREAADATVQAVANGYYTLLETRRLADVSDEAVRVDQQHVTQAEQFLAAGTVARSDVLRADTTLANDQVTAIRAHNTANLAESSLDNLLDYPVSTHLALTDSIAQSVPELSLETLQKAARENRGELQAAHFAIDAAQAAVGVARSQEAPSISLDASSGNAQPQVVSGYHSQFMLQLSAVWTLFDHGLTAGRIQQAESQLSNAKLAYRQAEQDVDLQVEQAYLNLQAARTGVEAAKRLVTFADENRRLAEERYRAGVGTAVEFADAQLNATSAQQNLVKALADQQTALVDARYAAGLLGR